MRLLRIVEVLRKDVRSERCGYSNAQYTQTVKRVGLLSGFVRNLPDAL
ncbi:hypothetical protein Z949_2395 [Sulfitobacter guttiformis KCTC 32187]|nr:hypothetical protein Z949_2395 [Sulfitobacter guttiformis KCTC 32187]